MKKLKSWLFPAIFIVSVVWSIYDWSRLDSITSRLHQIVWVAAALAVSEALFIFGAVLMAIEVGEVVSGSSSKLGRQLLNARRNLKAIMNTSVQTKRFGLGFWLNFTGALTTTLILAAGVVAFMPVASWGLLLLLILDLIATISWRFPLHVKRRQLRTGQL